MNLAEIRAFLETVRVPPNLELRVNTPFADRNDVLFTISTKWPDIDDPTRTFTGQVSRVSEILSLGMYPELLRAQICDLVHYAWEHELNEWLQIDGEYVKDPHPERRS